MESPFCVLIEARRRGDKANNQNGLENISEQFKALTENQGLTIQFYDLLPTPIQIFSPDGTCIFINRADTETLTGD